MREALERVIAELHKKARLHDRLHKDKMQDNRELNLGITIGLDMAIGKLKAVLADGDTTSNTAQVRSEENHN
jgi:hypothetical protein